MLSGAHARKLKRMETRKSEKDLFGNYVEHASETQFERMLETSESELLRAFETPSASAGSIRRQLGRQYESSINGEVFQLRGRAISKLINLPY